MTILVTSIIPFPQYSLYMKQQCCFFGSKLVLILITFVGALIISLLFDLNHTAYENIIVLFFHILSYNTQNTKSVHQA